MRPFGPLPLVLAALGVWAAGPAFAVETPESPAGLQGLYVTIHMVRQGETVSSLVHRYRTTRGTLEGLNSHLNLDALRPGDRVRILSRPGVFQKLQPGLTVSDIAQVYQMDPRDLLRVNGIANPRRLPANGELFIPDAGPLPDEAQRRLARRRATRVVRAPRGAFGKPVSLPGALVVSGSFGRRISPIDGQPQMHSGMDIVAPWGTPVLAARDGVVSDAGFRGGYGNLVILQHVNGIETRYGHMSDFVVKEGDHVTEGQVIGHVGSTGDSTSFHLHFEVRQGGTARDPRRYLTRYF